MHGPGIVPAAEYYLARRQYGRVQVEVLVVAQLPNVAAVCVHQVDIAGSFDAVPAGDCRVRSGRDEDDSAVGQIAGIEVVNVRMLTS